MLEVDVFPVGFEGPFAPRPGRVGLDQDETVFVQDDLFHLVQRTRLELPVFWGGRVGGLFQVGQGGSEAVGVDLLLR